MTPVNVVAICLVASMSGVVGQAPNPTPENDAEVNVDEASRLLVTSKFPCKRKPAASLRNSRSRPEILADARAAKAAKRVNVSHAASSDLVSRSSLPISWEMLEVVPYEGADAPHCATEEVDNILSQHSHSLDFGLTPLYQPFRRVRGHPDYAGFDVAAHWKNAEDIFCCSGTEKQTVAGLAKDLSVSSGSVNGILVNLASILSNVDECAK